MRLGSTYKPRSKKWVVDVSPEGNQHCIAWQLSCNIVIALLFLKAMQS